MLWRLRVHKNFCNIVRTLYLDLVSGISGDMFVGALLDLGMDSEALQSELAKLGLHGFHLHVSIGEKSGIAGTKFDVHVEEDHDHHHDDHNHAYEHHHSHHHSHSHEHEHEHEHSRTYAGIRDIIQRSALSDWVKQRSVAVFERIAVAEGKVHGLPAEEVHFHEVGALDSIVDIVGGCVGLELLGKPRVLASLVEEGRGWINCAHGRFPIPAPATLAILGARGIPVSQGDEPHELVTPTGAALLAEFVEEFGPMRGLVASKIGYGLGTRDNKTRPNVLRAILGESASTAGDVIHDWESDTVALLEANIDDQNPEILGYFSEQALEQGALDVFYLPVQMKKNRPGTLLTLLCAESEANRFCELILKQTSSLGVRQTITTRKKLRRDFKSVSTPYGAVKVKLGILDGKVIQAAPEYEDCKRISQQKNVPLKTVYEAAQKAL